MTKDELIKEIYGVMELLNTAHFPTRSELELVGKGSLMNHISRKYGGFNVVREELGLPKKPTSLKWRDEDIEKKIREVVSELNISHFPTHKEMVKALGDECLPNLVSRRGGYKHWSEKMCLNVKDGDTFYGHEGEDFFKALMTDRGYYVERLNTNCLYDFLVEGSIRVDVKISKLYNGENCSFYAYNLERKNPDCDIFVLITDNGEKRRIMIIPQQAVCGQKQISVGVSKSKWYAFEDRYDIIDKYISFYKEMKELIA